MRMDLATHVTRRLTPFHFPTKLICLSRPLMVSVRAATKAAAEKKEKKVKKETNGRIARRRRRITKDGGIQGAD